MRHFIWECMCICIHNTILPCYMYVDMYFQQLISSLVGFIFTYTKSKRVVKYCIAGMFQGLKFSRISRFPFK